MKKNYNSTLVFTAACTGMMLFGIVFLSLGTISTFLQEKLSLGALGAGSLASSLPLGILLGSLVFGPFADRFGYKWLLVFSTILISFALEVIAYGESLGVLQASFFVIGFGGGIINGGTNALAADITGQGKGAKLSLLGIFFGIGALGMPLVTGLLAKIWNYDTITSFIGVIILIPVIFFLTVRFPEPKLKQGFPIRKALHLIRNPLILFIGFILFFESGLEGLVSNWTTSFLTNRDVTSRNALIALSVQVAALIAGRLALSRLLRVYSPLVSFFICIVLIISGAFLLLDKTSEINTIISMILLGLGFAAGFPVMLGLAGELFPGLSGTAFSLVMAMALIGNMALNYSAGILSKLYGIEYFPWLLLVCAVLMTGLLFNIRNEFKSNK